jgi:hypothetical protein
LDENKLLEKESLKELRTKLHIKITADNNGKPVYYDYGNLLGPLVEMNLLENHYFIECEIPVTSFWINNYKKYGDEITF